eukprot:1158893-Pelagomonas_calceolata.AAC.20
MHDLSRLSKVKPQHKGCQKGRFPTSSSVSIIDRTSPIIMVGVAGLRKSNTRKSASSSLGQLTCSGNMDPRLEDRPYLHGLNSHGNQLLHGSSYTHARVQPAPCSQPLLKIFQSSMQACSLPPAACYLKPVLSALGLVLFLVEFNFVKSGLVRSSAMPTFKASILYP